MTNHMTTPDYNAKENQMDPNSNYNTRWQQQMVTPDDKPDENAGWQFQKTSLQPSWQPKEYHLNTRWQHQMITSEDNTRWPPRLQPRWQPNDKPDDNPDSPGDNAWWHRQITNTQMTTQMTTQMVTQMTTHMRELDDNDRWQPHLATPDDNPDDNLADNA
jgi:hypothetical protein